MDAMLYQVRAPFVRTVETDQLFVCVEIVIAASVYAICENHQAKLSCDHWLVSLSIDTLQCFLFNAPWNQNLDIGFDFKKV